MNQEIRSKITGLLKKCCELDEEQLNEKLTEKLEMDSLEVLTFILAVENEFEIEYQDFAKLSLHMDTLDEMISYLTDFVGQKGI